MALRRYVVILSLCACVSAIVGPAGNVTKTKQQKTDSYLDAYSKSRIEAEKAKQGVIIVTAKDGEKKISNRDDSYSGYDYSPPHSGDSTSFSSSGLSGFSGPSSSNSYLPPSSYGPPVKFEPEITYNSPPNTYGPPINTYGPPANTYGPPTQTYGPPALTYGSPAQNYGPPVQSYGPPAHKPVPVYGPPLKPTYGVPYTAPGFGFLDKLSLKLDILTVAKLLLKFLIFKKIVTMIAVVCMLLVIPKLISFKKDASPSGNDDDDRKFGDRNVIELTSAHQVLERAIAIYEKQLPICGVTCRVARVIDDLYEFQPYFRGEHTRRIKFVIRKFCSVKCHCRT